MQELLGHASAVTTQRYTGLPDGAMRAAAQGAESLTLPHAGTRTSAPHPGTLAGAAAAGAMRQQAQGIENDALVA